LRGFFNLVCNEWIKFIFQRKNKKKGRWAMKEIEEKTKKMCPNGIEEK
jgi:hypothetical protein